MSDIHIIEVIKQGPPGPPGSSANSYLHTQNTATNISTINHNLGFKPNIALFDFAGKQFDGEILYISINQTQVLLNMAVVGSTRLN